MIRYVRMLRYYKKLKSSELISTGSWRGNAGFANLDLPARVNSLSPNMFMGGGPGTGTYTAGVDSQSRIVHVDSIVRYSWSTSARE